MDLPFLIGLKLHSTNIALISDAIKLKKEGFFYYIELYIIPGTYEETIDSWKDIDVPYIIHAPHSFHGVNFAQADKWEINLRHFNETQMFADELCADIIIVHGGNNGYFTETIRQIELLNERRIALENKPKIGICNEKCVGWSPQEFHEAMMFEVISGTVLDFVHASYAANSAKIDRMKIIKDFMVFHPKVFHLSDGNAILEKDVHLNLGKGSMDLGGFLSVIPNGGLVTIETPRNELKGLEDFVNDIQFLHNLLAKQN